MSVLTLSYLHLALHVGSCLFCYYECLPQVWFVSQTSCQLFCCLLTACATCFIKCQTLPLHVCCTRVFAVFYSMLFFALWAIVCSLSWFAYSFVYAQSLSCLLFDLTLFSVLSALPLLRPTLVSAHYFLDIFGLLVLLWSIVWFLDFLCHLWTVLLSLLWCSL